MYKEIGKKIKGVATLMCVLGFMTSVVIGGVIIANGSEAAVLGLVVIVMGSALSWLSGFLLYGFGELIDTISDRVMNMLVTIQKNTHSTVLYEQMQYELMKIDVKNNVENK